MLRTPVSTIPISSTVIYVPANGSALLDVMPCPQTVTGQHKLAQWAGMMYRFIIIIIIIQVYHPCSRAGSSNDRRHKRVAQNL
jgi:hypothetical protein